IRQGIKALQAVEAVHPVRFRIRHGLVGGAAIDAVGACLPQETLDLCRQADAVLLGAVGGPKWDGLPPAERPERALLGLRRVVGGFANLRFGRLDPRIADISPLRAAAGGFDILLVRETTAGIFYGQPRGRRATGDGIGEEAFDTMVFRREQVARVARYALQLAASRRGVLHSVDQANVLESMRLWRETVAAVAAEFPDVTVHHLYVDHCAYELIREPQRFDVILTEGLLGGILSDAMGACVGSIGMVPSATVGDGPRGLFEPVHGSAPHMAGRDRANPTAAVLSVARLLEYGLGLPEAARQVDEAVIEVIRQGYRTYDIAPPGTTPIGTEEMGDRIAAAIRAAAA
ncbi:MAG: 3-isopropylmalate dehydrogenase, partial [Clostridia bacterium]|nr:3-isopropylmalate dehydrogenase [Clostridia bacterium]